MRPPVPWFAAASAFLLSHAALVRAQDPLAEPTPPATTNEPPEVPESRLAPEPPPEPAAVAPAPSVTPPAPTARPRALRRTAPVAGTAAAPASPEPIDEPEPVEELEPSGPAPVPLLDVWAGVGNTWITSRGFDAFAEDDALLGFSAGAGVTLVGGEGPYVRAVATFDLAHEDAAFRGEPASLDVLRFTLGPELRLPLGHGLDLLGRAGAVALQARAEIKDASAGATLEDSDWRFGAEGTLGLTWRIAAHSSSRPRLMFLLRAEGGYSWVPARSLELESSDAPRRSEALSTGELGLAGPFARAAVGVGF
jgi:hypothetical protein